MLSDEDFAVLNAVHLKKMVAAATIADVTGLTADRVDAYLTRASDRGLVMALPDGAMLLPEGIRAVLDYYCVTYAELRQQPELAAWYASFEVINAKFIA